MTEIAREDGSMTEHEKMELEHIASVDGYLYTFVSNESDQPRDVFFDDLTLSLSATDQMYFFSKDHLGSTRVLIRDDNSVVARYDYGVYGGRNRYAGSEETHYQYTGQEYDKETLLHNFRARHYSAGLGRFLAVDPAGQFASPYIGMGNNPVMMTDPDGEVAWFVPIIVGAAVGGTAGGIHAYHDPNMSIGRGILFGATIGGLSGGAAAGVSAIGGGAMLAGAAGGAVGGAGFSGMATGWDSQAMLRGAAIAAASGFVGGGFASAIGGGSGAFIGGVAADITGQLLSTGGVHLGQSLLAGGMSFGMYHAMSYGSYKFGGGNTEIAGRKLTYRQFNKINTAYQRSRFWKKEHGVYLNNDGSARYVPRNDRHKFHVTFDDWQQGDFGTFHSHWAKPGTEWANIGGAGKWRRYDPLYNYPAGSYKVTAVGNSFSPGDISGLIGNSYVAGRTGAHYMIGRAIGQFNPDPFLRLSLSLVV